MDAFVGDKRGWAMRKGRRARFSMWLRGGDKANVLPEQCWGRAKYSRSVNDSNRNRYRMEHSRKSLKKVNSSTRECWLQLKAECHQWKTCANELFANFEEDGDFPIVKCPMLPPGRRRSAGRPDVPRLHSGGAALPELNILAQVSDAIPDGAVPIQEGAIRRGSVQSDTLTIAPPDVEAMQHRVSIVGLHGEVIIDEIYVNSLDSVSSLLQRVNEVLQEDYSLIAPSGLTLRSRADASISELGICDGDMLVAVINWNAAAQHNQLSREDRIATDIEKLRSVLNDKDLFARVSMQQFGRLCSLQSTPCTNLVGAFRERLGLPPVSRDWVLNHVRAASDISSYSLGKDEFCRFLRVVMKHALLQLKREHQDEVEGTGASDARILSEVWIRTNLSHAGQEFLVLHMYHTGYRLRFWRADASCQMIMKFQDPGGPHLRMFVLDGVFKICGSAIRFDWQHCLSCLLEKCSSQRCSNLVAHSFQRCSNWEEIDIDVAHGFQRYSFGFGHSFRQIPVGMFTFGSIQLDHLLQFERQEIGSVLQAFNLGPHCAAGGF